LVTGADGGRPCLDLPVLYGCSLKLINGYHLLFSQLAIIVSLAYFKHFIKNVKDTNIKHGKEKSNKKHTVTKNHRI